MDREKKDDRVTKPTGERTGERIGEETESCQDQGNSDERVPLAQCRSTTCMERERV